jgi:hypothetical protein
MLAVRLVLTGATPLHGRLHSDPERLAAEVRSLAIDRGGDRIWIERIELETRSPRTMSVPDGPLEDLTEVIEELGSDPGSMSTVLNDLAELKRKLPAELLCDPDSPRLDDAAWLQTMLADVQPLLVDLLRKSATGAGDSRSAK